VVIVPISDPDAVLLSAAIGLIAVYVQYRLSIRNRRILLAKAFEVEIRLLQERQLSHLEGHELTLVEKAKTNEPFVVWYGRDNYKIYECSSYDLLILPEECVQRILEFYESDSTLRAEVTAMGSDNFGKLPVEKKCQHVSEVFRLMNGRYRKAREDALAVLARISSRRRLPL
jgi:hypothetical protein